MGYKLEMPAAIGIDEMENEIESNLKIHDGLADGGGVERSKSFAFRAPQESFSIQDFELGKIYGVGSYSKVLYISSQLLN